MSILDRLAAWTGKTRPASAAADATPTTSTPAVDALNSEAMGHDTMGNIATIDAAKAAPPPSPLAPIDLTDQSQVVGVMDIAARIGVILITSGTSNPDARAQVHLAASAYGLHYCHIDILTSTVTIHANMVTPDGRQQPLHVFRVAPRISLNFQKLAAVDKLIRSIHSGATPPAMAEKILDEIESMDPPISTLTTLVAWGAMGGFFSLILGGGAFQAIVSFFVAFIIMGVNTYLEKYRLPIFYQNIVGGFIAVLPAAVLFHLATYLDVDFSPSQVIGMGIIVLVAGLTLVQCIVDGITGAPVTSAARLLEAVFYTGAIVAGVGMGIQFVGYIGFELPPLATVAPPVYMEVPFLIIFGSLGSAAFAYACYASKKETVIAGCTAGAGMVFYYFLLLVLGIGNVVTAGIAAIAVGLAGGLMSRRFGIPPTVTMIIGYTPMLPGLTLYRGMYASLNDQTITGFRNLATAVAIAGALAAGVVLGERVARRLRRPQRFRPYSTFRKISRYSYNQATRLAVRTRSIPRVPMSPFAPRHNRPVPPPEFAGEHAGVRQTLSTSSSQPSPTEDAFPATTSWPAQTPTTYTSPGTGEWPEIDLEGLAAEQSGELADGQRDDSSKARDREQDTGRPDA